MDNKYTSRLREETFWFSNEYETDKSAFTTKASLIPIIRFKNINLRLLPSRSTPIIFVSMHYILVHSQYHIVHVDVYLILPNRPYVRNKKERERVQIENWESVFCTTSITSGIKVQINLIGGKKMFKEGKTKKKY